MHNYNKNYKRYVFNCLIIKKIKWKKRKLKIKKGKKHINHAGEEMNPAKA